jgi:hypothetical protein
MNAVCVTVWRRGEIHRGSWQEKLKKRNHLENLKINKKIILKLILTNGMEGCGLDLSCSGEG